MYDENDCYMYASVIFVIICIFFFAFICYMVAFELNKPNGCAEVISSIIFRAELFVDSIYIIGTTAQYFLDGNAAFGGAVC